MSFRDGKYVFDFGSRWSTWVDVDLPNRRWDLDIGGPGGRECGWGAARFDLENVKMTVADSGRLFTYTLSSSTGTAARQRACIAQKTTLQPTCNAP